MEAKTRLLIICVLLTLFISTGLIVHNINSEEITSEVLVYWGMYGDRVVEIQQKLQRWGYYDGSIDGYYGALTFDAVKRFQIKNGLVADGAVGSQTAAAMGINLDAPPVYDTETG